MGLLYCVQGCPRCGGDLYFAEDAWEEYVVCWNCGHVLTEPELDRLIELRRMPIYLKPLRKAS